MKRTWVLVGLLASGAAHAVPDPAAAALTATPTLRTRDGATQLVVTVTSRRRLTTRTRPRGVTVVAGVARYALRRSGAAVAGSVWSTRWLRGASATALLGLEGRRVAITVRTRAGTTTVRRRVPAPPADDDAATPPPGGPQPGGVPQPSPTAPSKAEQALAVVRQYLGTPFTYGGADPATGFDAPGLTQYAYRRVGIELPRLAEQQFAAGTPAPQDAVRPGDLVFFADATGYVFHVGVFAGNGEFIHAPHTGDVVKVSRLEEPYYRSAFAGARHIAD